jgi:hypothetical protein
MLLQDKDHRGLQLIPPFKSDKKSPAQIVNGPFRNHEGTGVASVPISARLAAIKVIRESKTECQAVVAPSGKIVNDGALTQSDLKTVDFSKSAIRQQLTCVLHSRIFVQSDKLSRFLRFIVEHVIDGSQDCLKEYVIGSEVYDRKPPYHPSQDSIVRTEALRLRGKLREYYETEGKEDPIYVHLRPGSYIPIF